MEIETTIRELSPQLQQKIGKPLETKVWVIVEDAKGRTEHSDSLQKDKSKFPFLESEVWDDPNAPTDGALNHDKYIYDLDPHGR